MKLKEYKKHIDKLIKQGHGELDVYYASDDEGNSYHPVTYAPSLDDCVQFSNDHEPRIIIN